MRRLDFHPTAGQLGKVPFKSLYSKEIYDAPTADGWVLQISRYQPIPQPWDQPIFGAPLLLVHGWSQNRHAWSCGGFVKQLLAYGADIHVLELRGHGLSSRELQAARGLAPKDLNWGWDLDSYFLHDVPAGVRAVKAKTGRKKIVYVGNSMGGMLGYGYAGCHDDLAGLVAIGAPSDIGRGYAALRAAARFGPPLVGPLLDAAFSALSAISRIRNGKKHIPVRFDHVPVDRLLKALSRAATEDNLRRYHSIARYVGSLLNPSRVIADDFRWLLDQGGEKEPRRVVEQFARWIRNDEMKCYSTGYDFKAHFERIRIPMAIFFGDLDKIASPHSTHSIVRKAKSAYLQVRPVKENSHLELTMGSDIHQICEDVKDLVQFALEREDRVLPSVPRE